VRRVGQVRSWAPTGPLTVFVCLLTLLGVLAATIGLDASGWLAGVACGAGLAALLTNPAPNPLSCPVVTQTMKTTFH
jgi:hypothetical protein